MKNSALREYRRRLGKSQDWLAKRARVTEQAVSLWETGRRRPRAKYLPRLAKALKVEVADLT